MRYELVTPALLSGLKAQAQSAEVEQGREAALLVQAEVIVQLIDRIEELQAELEDRIRYYHGSY